MSKNKRIRIFPIFLILAVFMVVARFSDIAINVFLEDGDSYNSFTADDLASLVSGEAVAQETAEPPSLEAPDEEAEDTAGILDPNDLPEGMVPTDLEEQEDLFSTSSLEDMSPGEIRLLHDLVARRETLEKRERVIREREALLRSAERQLLDKQKQLEDIKLTIEELLSDYKEEQSEEARRLVKIYSSMKPKAAARIFNDMDMDTLVQVFRGMKERAIAPIMASMNAEKARLVTRELSEINGLEEIEGALR